MSKVFDCATPLTAPVANSFKRDGFEAVARYLVPSGWKALTRAEADRISEAGLQIISVYETTASRALGGRGAGLVDGASAVLVAEKVGQLKGSTIYFAVDFDASNADMPAVIEYIKAASEATPEYNTGVYGSARVIKAVMAAGACSRFWQTYAWSRGEVVQGIHIHQHDNGPNGLGLPMNGIIVDLNKSFGNEGWWNTLMPAPPVKEEYLMSPEDANKIIGFLSAAHGSTSDPEAQDEFHRLANELRKASGQPEQ
jgi:hypothetical protein